MGQTTDVVADWQAVAGAWAGHAEALAEHTRPVSEAMADLLAPRPGEHVLEVAAGTGELSQTLAAAVAPGGAVVCTDAAPAMVEAARRRIGDGVSVDVRVADVQDLPLPDDAVDAVVCKMGLMLVERPDVAVRECRRVLRPGGRMVAATWGPMTDNPWLTLVGIGLLVNGHALPGDPTGPGGVFSLATPDELRAVLVEAGFDQVRVEAVDVPAHHSDVDEMWRVRSETAGPLTRRLDQLSEAEVAAVRESCIEHAAAFRDVDGTYTLPGRALVALAG